MVSTGGHIHAARTRGDVTRRRNQEMARLYDEEGISLEDVAVRFGLRPSTVSDILRMRRVALRRQPRRRPPSRFSQRNEEMARLYVDEGLNLREIAARFGVSHERVRQILMTAGVSRKTLSHTMP